VLCVSPSQQRPSKKLSARIILGGYRFKRVLGTSKVRADLVVIESVVLQNATQLRFVEHDQVIEAFAPDRADEALDVAVLPR
jgi:hypothetical protein